MKRPVIHTVPPALLLVVGISVAQAQQAPASSQAATSPSDQTSVSEPTLKESPMKQLQKFEAPAGEEYRLGPGDEISLEFPARPELNSKHVIGPDGRITLPVAGSVEVGDKTRDEAGKAVVEAMKPYYSDLAVTVRIDKYGSNRVVIIGNVQHPGVLYFDETPRLLDVIARGGIVVNPTSANSPGTRDGIPERVAIYRGNDQVFWVELRQLLKSGNPLADLRLRRNDIVFVPAQQDVFVSVLGAVNHPGAIPLSPESTLPSVIAEAGGPAEGAGGNIQVVSPSTGKTTTIPFKELVTLAGSHEVTLHAGDIVYLNRSGFYKTTYVFQRITPFITMATLGALIAP